MHQDKDRSSKWLIGHFGDAILSLGGHRKVLTWRTIQAELVAPRRLPDGLIEATFADSTESELFLIEIETYSNNDMDRQVFEDLLLIALDRGIIPDVITLVLRPKGNVQPEGRHERVSRRMTARLGGSWQVVELWKLQAADLLATNDVGLIPWVPLTTTDLPAEELLQQCRERIDRDAKPSDVPGLLAVTQLLAALVHPRRRLLEIFGGAKAMIESPWLDEVKQMIADDAAIKTLRSAIIGNLEARFGFVANERFAALDAISDEARLRRLHSIAATCTDVNSFFAQANLEER